MPARFLLFIFLFGCFRLSAQRDSILREDSVRKSSAPLLQTVDSASLDSLHPAVKFVPLRWQLDTAFNHFFINKKLPLNKQSVYAINAVRQPSHNDEQFYILAGLFLFTGIVRASFPKYFTTLFQSFFQSSHRQRQSKESLAQDTLPSFLMNVVFILSGGLLLAAFIRGDDNSRYIAFPLLWLYSCAALAVVYLIKSFSISLFGWSFDVVEAAGNYRFIVFLVNKVGGLCFMPLLLVFLYSTGDGFTSLSTISVVLVCLLLLYRYIVSLSLVGKKLKIHPLHFFLYLCAVEILPLLITYKVLLITKEL